MSSRGFDWGHASALRGSPSPQSSPIKGEEESRFVSVGPVYFDTNSSCRLAAAHQGMKGWSCGLVRRIGTVGSPAPRHPDPSGGQAPALHSPSPPLWIPAFAGMTNGGSLAPAHQGLKSGSCGLARRVGTADSATPLLRPSGGQAPALHSPSRPFWIPAFAGMTNSLDYEMPILERNGGTRN